MFSMGWRIFSYHAWDMWLRCFLLGTILCTVVYGWYRFTNKRYRCLWAGKYTLRLNRTLNYSED